MNLNRFSLVDGAMVPDENGEWCQAPQVMDIMSNAAATVYSQVVSAVEYTTAAKLFTQQIKSYLENTWGMG